QYFDGFMTGSSSFGNMTMSKSASGSSKLTLLDNAEITGTLTLANSAFGGKIVTGISQLYITNNSPSAIVNVSTTSYVEGNLRRNLNGSLASATYQFPLGHATPGWQHATVDFTSTHSIPNMLGYFSPWSSFPGATGLTDGGACPVTYNTSPGFYDNGYWTLTPSANASSANYDLQVRNGGVTNGPGLNWTVAKAPTISGSWSLDGLCTSVSYPFAKRTGMNGFSVFASAQTSNPLPISLLSFDAEPQGLQVLVTWVTESETNNDYFIIERTQDGQNFEKVGTHNGAGNSAATLHYSMIDAEPLKGLSYYRLRQVDFDGKESLSQLVAVNFSVNNVLNVFPNPAQTEIQYSFNAASDGVVLFELTDALGKTILSQKVNVQKGFNVSDPLSTRFIPQGVYLIQLKPLNSEIIEPMQKRFIRQAREE
ncbi:MAG TPA: T9SS type A sorting domain-containing protein, partial [Bacteroidia bacterium]|nr:T9SS type A sorting domain-containing protein [Bacteroidia bacterium]